MILLLLLLGISDGTGFRVKRLLSVLAHLLLNGTVGEVLVLRTLLVLLVLLALLALLLVLLLLIAVADGACFRGEGLLCIGSRLLLYGGVRESLAVLLALLLLFLLRLLLLALRGTVADRAYFCVVRALGFGMQQRNLLHETRLGSLIAHRTNFRGEGLLLLCGHLRLVLGLLVLLGLLALLTLLLVVFVEQRAHETHAELVDFFAQFFERTILVLLTLLLRVLSLLLVLRLLLTLSLHSALLLLLILRLLTTLLLRLRVLTDGADLVAGVVQRTILLTSTDRSRDALLTQLALLALLLAVLGIEIPHRTYLRTKSCLRVGRTLTVRTTHGCVGLVASCCVVHPIAMHEVVPRIKEHTDDDHSNDKPC